MCRRATAGHRCGQFQVRFSTLLLHRITPMIAAWSACGRATAGHCCERSGCLQRACCLQGMSGRVKWGKISCWAHLQQKRQYSCRQRLLTPSEFDHMTRIVCVSEACVDAFRCSSCRGARRAWAASARTCTRTRRGSGSSTTCWSMWTAAAAASASCTRSTSELGSCPQSSSSMRPHRDRARASPASPGCRRL